MWNAAWLNFVEFSLVDVCCQPFKATRPKRDRRIIPPVPLRLNLKPSFSSLPPIDIRNRISSNDEIESRVRTEPQTILSSVRLPLPLPPSTNNHDGETLLFCPHCSGGFLVDSINCNVFRHGVYKEDGSLVPPHSTKEQIDYLLAHNLIFGCGKPFRYDGHGLPSACDYI